MYTTVELQTARVARLTAHRVAVVPRDEADVVALRERAVVGPEPVEGRAKLCQRGHRGLVPLIHFLVDV